MAPSSGWGGAMKRRSLLALAVGLQVAVLGGEYLGSVWPAWTGQRITLRVQPVDPRSWFSGNYAQLTYDITMIPRELYRGSEPRLRKGEVVYVTLEPRGDAWVATGLLLSPPAAGTFLRGRLEWPWREGSDLRVRYGIEAWFAPKEEALAIERSIARGAWRDPRGAAVSEMEDERSVFAQVAVTSSGRAALVGLDY